MKGAATKSELASTDTSDGSATMHHQVRLAPQLISACKTPMLEPEMILVVAVDHMNGHRKRRIWRLQPHPHGVLAKAEIADLDGSVDAQFGLCATEKCGEPVEFAVDVTNDQNFH